MTRIAMICRHAGGSGSVGFVAVRQAKELAKRFDITLLSETFPDEMPGVRKLSVRGRNFDFLRRFAHVPNERAFAAAARKALFALHAEQPLDLVLCHSHASAALSALPLKERHGVPVAVFCHGDIFDRPPGTYDQRLTRFFEQVAPIAYRHSDLVLVLSRVMAESVVKHGGSAERVVVIANGIDPVEVGLGAVPAPRTDAGPLRLLYVGRLSVEKGPAVLLAAVDQLGDVELMLTVVGGGPLEGALRTSTQDHRVIFAGSVPRLSLGGFYQQADLFVAPSLSEAFGVTAIEALAAGTPVVATRIGGYLETIVEGVNGLLVPAGDPSALAAAIRALVEDRPRLAALAANASASVERYGWNRVAAELADAIERAIR